MEKSEMGCFKFSALLLGTVAVNAAMVSFADEAVSADALQVQDTVIVEGQVLYSDQVNSIKAPTPIIDVPQSLSITSAEQILKQGFTSVGDIINYTPGVNTSQGEGHRDAVVFRGVRSTADFFVDGVRDDVQYYRSLYNLEQVEILRGPNALLFGRGGTGGVLNRVTKKAAVGENFTGYKASLDTFGEYDVQLDQNFTTNDASAVRVNAFYESLANDRDFYDGERVGINPTARFLLTANTSLDLSYEFADNERFIDRGIPTGANGEPVEAFKDIVFGDPDINTTEFTGHVVRANLQHKFNDALKGNITVSYGDYDKSYQNFYVSAYDQTNTPDVVTLDGYVDSTQRENFTFAGNLVGEFATGSIAHTLILGGEFIDTGNDNDRFNARWSSNGFTDDNDTFLITRPLNLSGGIGVNSDGIATSNNFYVDGSLNDKTTSEIESLTFYVQDQIEVNQYFDIVLGARFYSFDQTSTNLAADDATPVSRKDEEVSPRLGLIYKPQENISVYASYSESFLPTSGEQFASTGSLDPDVYENAEIGLKWDFAPALSFTAAYFQSEQVSAARDDITGEGFEIRGLEIDGVELQLQGQVTPQLSVSAGYSYLDGETDQGREEPRELPEHMVSAWANYQVTDKFGLGLGAFYQDESFITDYDIGSTGAHPTLPAFTRVDAAAYYDVSEALRLQLNIENLTDEVYFPSAHSTHQATVGAPLNARFTISGKF